MTDLESARELERLMRAYGDGVLRLCYVCLRDGDAGRGTPARRARPAYLKSAAGIHLRNASMRNFPLDRIRFWR